MHDRITNIEQIEKWRTTRYSSIFTRHNFQKILTDDLALFDGIIMDYGGAITKKDTLTYKDYLIHIFRYLTQNYRNEYIIKNALLNALICKYGTTKTIALNEFAVGESIADMVLFNGCSKAFEIKTEYDTPKRLATQLADYKKIFQYCYLVVHRDSLPKYSKEVDESIGVITYCMKRGRFSFEEFRSAKENLDIDPHLLMRCLHTDEYKKIVQTYYGYLPTMNSFTAFDICEESISKIPSEELHKLFIKTVKERKSNMKHLKSYDSCMRQMCLSMHLTPNEYEIINTRLLTTVKL